MDNTLQTDTTSQTSTTPQSGSSNYSPKDIAFLKALKSQGVSPQEAFSRLAKVKNSVSSSAVTETTESINSSSLGEGNTQSFSSSDQSSNPAPNPVGDFVGNVGRGIQEAGANAVSAVAKGVGNTVQAGGELLDTINPVNIFSRVTGIGKPTNVAQTITKPIQQGANWLGDQPLEVAKKSGLNPESGAGQVGGFLGNVASQVPTLIGGGALLSHVQNLPKVAEAAQAYPTIAKVLGFAAKSAGSTGITKAATEGSLPSPEELGGYGLLDLITHGAEKLGGNIYKEAFKGTKGQEKNLVQQFGKTVGEVAQELGYSGSAKEIAGQAKEANKTIWSNLVDAAKKNEPVTRDQFMSIADKLVKPFEKLPDSQYKKDAIQAVKDVVSSYAPATSATGNQLVETISNINKGLFGDGTRTVLNPKQASSLAGQLKSGIKDLLPNEVKPLYEQFAKNKLIENIMNDHVVKKLVARSLAGAGTGAVIGVGEGLAAHKDPIGVVKDALIGSITSALMARATGSTKILTTTGKALQKASKPAVQAIVKNVANSLENQLFPKNK